MRSRFDIKICGLSTPETLDSALNAGATMVGFVFVPGSPRHITPHAAAPLIEQAEGKALTVGLVANMAADDIMAAQKASGCERIQIHGQESDATRASLLQAFPEAMMARGIATEEDLPGPDTVPPKLWLFDARPPKGEALAGGHGRRFDWTILSQYRGATPFLLAGGLTSENVGEAVTSLKTHPRFAGVDVSSGVESAPGIKDPARIAAFVSAAQAARGSA